MHRRCAIDAGRNSSAGTHDQHAARNAALDDGSERKPITGTAGSSGYNCRAAALQHQGFVSLLFMVGLHLAWGALVEVPQHDRSIRLGIFSNHV